MAVEPGPQGGGYPLLRVVARFLRVDHHRIVVGFRTLPDGLSVVSVDPENDVEPDAWAIVWFDGITSPETASAAIESALRG